MSYHRIAQTIFCKQLTKYSAMLYSFALCQNLLAITVSLSSHDVSITSWEMVKTYLEDTNIEPGHISELHMSDFNITYMPSWIVEQKPNLKILGLDNNALYTLPDNICHLKNLEHLFLDCNNLRSLPASLSHLNNLLYISSSHNRLSSIPPQFASIPKLKSLNLSGNPIISLPDTFTRLTNQIFCLGMRGTNLRKHNKENTLRQETLQNLFANKMLL